MKFRLILGMTVITVLTACSGNNRVSRDEGSNASTQADPPIINAPAPVTGDQEMYARMSGAPDCEAKLVPSLQEESVQERGNEIIFSFTLIRNPDDTDDVFAQYLPATVEWTNEGEMEVVYAHSEGFLIDDSSPIIYPVTPGSETHVTAGIFYLSGSGEFCFTNITSETIDTSDQGTIPELFGELAVHSGVLYYILTVTAEPSQELFLCVVRNRNGIDKILPDASSEYDAFSAGERVSAQLWIYIAQGVEAVAESEISTLLVSLVQKQHDGTLPVMTGDAFRVVGSQTSCDENLHIESLEVLSGNILI